MNILVINCGSSSLKYQLLETELPKVLAKGLIERIGQAGSVENHQIAIQQVLATLTDKNRGVISSLQDIHAVGHRVVHGGEKFHNSVIIDDNVIQALKDCSKLAPLHNPHNLTGIRACQELLPQVPQVAVFDTAFHQTMKDYVYLYGLPYELYEKHGIRRYGFHGTSHKYVSQRAAIMLGKPLEDTKIITCHLGNGASIAAIDGGKVVDTSMGLTPLEGLVMGTRCGNIDPAIVTFIMEQEGLGIDEVTAMLNKQSGVKGVSGLSSDFRDLVNAAYEGDKRAKLALDVFGIMVKKYIGAYAALLNGVDALIFTAGLGENSSPMRSLICANMEYLGISLDEVYNEANGVELDISTVDSKVRIFVVPTNEELMIAKDTEELVS